MLYDTIRKICIKKKIHVSNMEKDLNFPRSSICKWNESEPGIRKVQKVAKYLGVQIEELLEKEEAEKEVV